MLQDVIMQEVNPTGQGSGHDKGRIWTTPGGTKVAGLACHPYPTRQPFLTLQSRWNG
jgi:hypothetical protein